MLGAIAVSGVDFVLDVLVVFVFGCCGGGRGGAGYVWTVYEMACFLFHVQGM